VLTLFHDYTSPACAVAVRRVQRLADEGLDVAFEGFDVQMVDVPLPVTLEVSAALADLAGDAAAEGLELRRPPALPPTALAHVVAGAAEEQGMGASWRQAAYSAFWSRGTDLGDRAVLVALARDAGLDPDPVTVALADRLVLAAVRRRMAGHRRNGVGGVPVVLASRTLVPGLLPLPDLRALAALA